MTDAQVEALKEASFLIDESTDLEGREGLTDYEFAEQVIALAHSKRDQIRTALAAAQAGVPSEAQILAILHNKIRLIPRPGVEQACAECGEPLVWIVKPGTLEEAAATIRALRPAETAEIKGRRCAACGEYIPPHARHMCAKWPPPSASKPAGPSAEDVARAIERAAQAGVFSGEEIQNMLATGFDVATYIERACSIKIPGAVLSGIEGILRDRMLPLLSERPRAVLALLQEPKK